jgi:starvation-inducible DNA-binding protein
MALPKMDLVRSDDLETKVEKRSHVAEALCGILADSYGLLVKTQNYHWNVRGPRFVGIHKLTEEQYKELFAAIDDLAERIRALGFFTPGSFKQFATNMSLHDAESDMPPAESAMIQQLEADHMKLVADIKEAIKICEQEEDTTTADMLSERRGAHEKAAWMLRSLNA